MDIRQITGSELQKLLHRVNQEKYYNENLDYYQTYQYFHYRNNKGHRRRTAKKLYYKKRYNKEIFFVKPPANYEEYMLKWGFKVKYH